jgi:hypothetical protein
MNMNLVTRETKFTAEEFASLARNDEGLILDDFDIVWCFMTDQQKSELHEDDDARAEELEQEM